jgi:hypothetical protein
MQKGRHRTAFDAIKKTDEREPIGLFEAEPR